MPAPPDPGSAATLDDIVERLRSLKVWASDPSYGQVTGRVNAAWTAAGRPTAELVGRTTVVDCFRPGRRRLNVDLVVAVVSALHPETGYVAQWQQALRVVGGRTGAAAQVRVQDALPPEPPGFTGRGGELARLRRALRGGSPVVIAGMAGVGKTRLAVHIGHSLSRDGRFDRVLFVDLRGFHPDPRQPPVSPFAVLDGFLRLLGMPGQRIPQDLAARVAAYRQRLAGSRTLVVLDNAAGEEQVRPLLPAVPDCPVLVTSRRALPELREVTHLTVPVLPADDAVTLLRQASGGIPVGPDAGAAARLARGCGYLPLALGLLAGHIGGTPGWTLTDHADRLDERHRERRLDTCVEITFDLSYRGLPAGPRRLLRLVALHPGQDVDGYAAAALAGTDLPTTLADLRRLRHEHLLNRYAGSSWPGDTGRYTCHDLVRAHAARLAADEDPPPARRAALTRLSGYYLAAAAAAMDSLYPAEAQQRPAAPPAGTPVPHLVDTDAARAWLDTERPNLVSVTAHAARHDPLATAGHAAGLSGVLYRYLDGGYAADALAIHGHALHAARRAGDPFGQADALACLGSARLRLGHLAVVGEHFTEAVRLRVAADDRTGTGRATSGLGVVAERLGHYPEAIEHLLRALPLLRSGGDRTGEARALDNLAIVESRLGRHRAAARRCRQALALFQQTGDLAGEARALNNLGWCEVVLGAYGPAVTHLRRSLALSRRLNIRTVEAWTLDSVGMLYARAHAGLGRAYRRQRRPGRARRQLRLAHGLYARLGSPEAARFTALLRAGRRSRYPAR